MSGAFVDPEATEEFEVCRPCICPNSPHEADIAILRTEFGQGDIDELTKATMPAPGMFDVSGPNWRLLQIGVKDWSFTNGTGKKVPVDDENLKLLKPAIATKITERLDEHYTKAKAELPNASGAPSLRSLPAAAGPNRATRRARQR